MASSRPRAWSVERLIRVVAGLAAAVEERPVARLDREQLARRALQRRARQERRASARSSRSSSRRAAVARSATAGESQVRRSLSSPQLERRSGRGSGSWRSAASPSVTSSSPCSAAAARTSSSQAGPSHHQCPSSSVSIAKTISPRRPRSAANRSSRAATAATNSRPCSLARASRGGRVVRSAADRPRARAAQRLAMEVGEGGIGRVAVQRPEPTDRLPVDRERRGPAAAAIGASAAERRLVRGSGRCRSSASSRSASSRSSPGSYAHSGSQNPLELAEPAPVRAQPGVDLQPAAGAGGNQRQHRVGRRRGEQLDAARSAAGSANSSQQARRRAPRAARAPRGSGRPRRGTRRGRAPRRPRVGVAATRSGSGAGTRAAARRRRGLELVGEHRRDGERQPSAARRSTGT